MRRFRSVLLNFCLLIGTVVACFCATELVLTLRQRLTAGAPGRTQLVRQREEFLNRKYGPLIAERPERGWDNSLVLHPLFGYVYNPELAAANNFGFLCPSDFGLRQGGYFLEGVDRSRSLVIGVFGGSYAQQMVENTHDYFAERLRSAFPQRDPVIVNFAIAGHGIPQSVFIFEYFRGIPDVVLFVDGFNEIINYIGNNRAGVPPEYAKAAHYLYKLSLDLLTPERFAHTARILDLRQRLARLTSFSLLPGIRRSLAVHMTWAAIAQLWEGSLARESKELEVGFDADKRFFGISDEEMIAISAKQWRDYHRLVHQVARTRGVLDLHFLQPNPFVPESKRHLTDFEKKILESGRGEVQDFLVLGYSRIGKELGALARDDGVTARDLTMLFEDRNDEIWVDTCHANAAGYRMTVDEIVRVLSERGVPPPRGE